MRFLNYLALATSLVIAGIAATYSVIGLATIFAGAYLGVVIMASALEIGKIITAAYIHLVWDKLSIIKYYLAFSVFVLMLITSLGIFGYLSKAHSDVSYGTGNAVAESNRIQSAIDREENKIEILEGRIINLGVGKIDVSSSVNAQTTIRDGAWDRVQGDIEYAEGNITSLRTQLTTLDSAVNELRNKGVEVITLDEGGAFRGSETETIDYVTQANTLFEQQSEQREQIRADIKVQTDNIDRYRKETQTTINNANAEIKRLQSSSTGDADEIIEKTDEYNLQIDGIYDIIDELKDEKFTAEAEIRSFEREIGPIKYITEALFGQDEAAKYMDNAVRYVIMALIFVFDPLAILLLISATGLIARREPTPTEPRIVIQVPKQSAADFRKAVE